MFLADSFNLVSSVPLVVRVFMISVWGGVESIGVFAIDVLSWQLELDVDGAGLFSWAGGSCVAGGLIVFSSRFSSVCVISMVVGELSVFWVVCLLVSMLLLGLLPRVGAALYSGVFLQWFEVWPVCLHEKHVTVSSDRNIRYSV